MVANNSSAVMARRGEPTDSLDFFPTPPWATRALFQYVLKRSPRYVAGMRAWEPAAGEGHMAEVLREFFSDVFASDIHDYDRGYVIGDYLGTLLRSECPFRPEWVITNPPFNEAAGFLARALVEAKWGVALLLRLSWLEGAERWREIFRHTPPHDRSGVRRPRGHGEREMGPGGILSHRLRVVRLGLPGRATQNLGVDSADGSAGAYPARRRGAFRDPRRRGSAASRRTA